jgi:murein DD-endopeptidase MepM/ murein hydrolase activator NlpD
MAVRDGTVITNAWHDTRGWYIVLEHVSDDGDKFRTLYQHLAAQSPLKVGQEAKAGQRIGIMGKSTKTIAGMAMHLHMEVQVPINGKWTPVDFAYQLDHIKEEDGMTEDQVRKIIKEELAKSGASPSSWAKADWEQAKKDGVTDGTKPQAIPTREQVVTMIYRAVDKTKKA